MTNKIPLREILEQKKMKEKGILDMILPKKDLNKVENIVEKKNPLETEEDEMARMLLLPSARITIEDEDPEARIFTMEDR